MSPTPSPFGAPVFSVGPSSLSNAKASSPIQNLRPAPACLPIAPHTLTWGPWETCDSDGVSDNESGNELAAAGFQEQIHGPRQTGYLGLGPPGPDWEEDWTAAFLTCPYVYTPALYRSQSWSAVPPCGGAGNHLPVSCPGTSWPLAWPGLASHSLIHLPGLEGEGKKETTEF